MIDSESETLASYTVNEEEPKHVGATELTTLETRQHWSNRMLSVSFAAPLAGPARSERLKQMTSNHPAFEKSRVTQEILVKIQHSLRRMPGVSASESNEIISQLQEVGQIVNQETSQLVDALMNLNLDQEDTDKAIARMSIEANLAKATADDQAQTITNLRDEVKGEKVKKDQAEAEIKKMMEDLEDLTAEFKRLKDKAEKQQKGDDTSDDEDIVKSLEETIQTLEEQINKHRTLWVMRRSNPDVVARAIETVNESALEKSKFRSMHPGKPGSANMMSKNDGSGSDDAPGVFDIPPARAATAFQPMRRQPSTGPPTKFGQLQAGPPRAPNSAQDRRFSGPWGQHGHGGGSSANGSRASSYGNAPGPFGNPSFRAPSRKGFHSNNANNNNNNSGNRYRSNFQQSSFAMHELPHRPTSAFAFDREFFPNTPTAPSRSRLNSRTRDGRNSSLDYSVDHSTSSVSGPNPGNAMVSTRSSFSGSSHSHSNGPALHISDRVVNMWHEQVMEFYACIRGFVERHANQPTYAQTAQLSTTPLWPILLATYHPLSESEASSYLDFHLRNENSKSCLVTRVIIDFIVNRVWVPGAWTGVDGSSTYALVELDRELERTLTQPSIQRQPLLDRQANIIDSIMKSESSSPFLRAKIEETTTTLLSNLQPLLNKFAAPADAYRAMEQVVEEAWQLSWRIMTSRLTFDFRFPEIGSRFSSQSMLPIWPSVDASELQAKHWRVALVTTPVITCRNDTGGNISAHSVALADVFCMQ